MHTYIHTYIHTYEHTNIHTDAGRDGWTGLARPNSQARTGTGEYSFPLFSWPRAGLATLPGWSIFYYMWWPYIHTYTAVVHQTVISLLLFCSRLFNTASCIETQSMCPATLYTMCRTRQPRPIRPISNTPRWARRRRYSVALRMTTCKAHSDWASIDALAVFELPACPSGTPGPTCSLFQAVCNSTWEVLYIYIYIYLYLAHGRWAQRAINRLPAPHIQQRCHLACGHEASSYLTLSATEARTIYLILSRNDPSLDSAPVMREGYYEY